MSATSRILVTGSTGHLGRHVVETLAIRRGDPHLTIATLSRCAPATLKHFQVDITDRNCLLACLRQYEPTHIIHLAALASPAKADRVRRLAWATNVKAVETLASHSREHGSRLIFTSTDFVFRGDLGRPYTEADQPDPATFYGQTKHAAEQFTSSSGGVIIRLSLLRRSFNATIPFKMTPLIKEGLRKGWLAAADDEYRTPLHANDAAAAIVRLAFMDVSGVFHVAGPETLSAYTLLSRELEGNGLNIDIRKVKRESLMPPSRPDNVSLSTSKLRGLCPDLRFANVAPLQHACEYENYNRVVQGSGAR